MFHKNSAILVQTPPRKGGIGAKNVHVAPAHWRTNHVDLCHCFLFEIYFDNEIQFKSRVPYDTFELKSKSLIQNTKGARKIILSSLLVFCITR